MSRAKASLPVLRADFDQAAQRYARAMEAFTAAKRPGRGRCIDLDLNSIPPMYACDWRDSADIEELCERCRAKWRNRAAFAGAREEQRLAKNQFRRAWKRWQEAEKR